MQDFIKSGNLLEVDLIVGGACQKGDLISAELGL